MATNGRNIVLFGPPGVGKGAQAEILSHNHGLVHLSTGEVIRDEIGKRTELGARVASAVERGDLADDETVLEIVMHRIDLPEYRNGFVMDGFPRTLTQAKRFDALLAERDRHVNHSLFIVAPESTVLARLGGRLICSQCGKTYHREFNRPRIDQVCDVCKGRIRSRHDDNPEIHRERLREYAEKTAPLADYYESRGVLTEIDGDQSIEDVAKEIEQVIAGS